MGETLTAVEKATPARVLSFDVKGAPAPQGSKTAFNQKGTGKAMMKESSKKLKPWRTDVKEAAEAEIAARGWTPLDGPVDVQFFFRFNRPKSVSYAKRPLPTVYPDFDKLARSTCDALKAAGVYRDDCLIVDGHIKKRYASSEETAGCMILVREHR